MRKFIAGLFKISETVKLQTSINQWMDKQTVVHSLNDSTTIWIHLKGIMGKVNEKKKKKQTRKLHTVIPFTQYSTELKLQIQ